MGNLNTSGTIDQYIRYVPTYFFYYHIIGLIEVVLKAMTRRQELQQLQNKINLI